MEKKKTIRIGVRITEAIIEILKDELGEERKRNGGRSKKTKALRENNRQSSS